jgi:hypothetical protein
MNDDIPKSIAILGVNIPIIEHAPEEDSEDDGLCGYYDTSLLEIRVHEGLSLEHKKIVVLHEALHCVEDLLSLKVPHNAIFALSQCFYAMIKQNPAMFEWLHAEDKK